MSSIVTKFDKTEDTVGTACLGPLLVCLSASKHTESGALMRLLCDTNQSLSGGPTWAGEVGTTVLAPIGQGDSDGFDVEQP